MDAKVSIGVEVVVLGRHVLSSRLLRALTLRHLQERGGKSFYI